MILNTFCTICWEEDKKEISRGEINSTLFSICQCNNNHKQIQWIMDDQYQLLYKSGVNALIEGFYSESVSSLNSALESAYEVFVKSTLISDHITFEDVETFWKDIKLSERRYGAFCYSYFLTTNKVWSIKDKNKMIALRNKIIHDGYIAVKGEAVQFGSYITEALKVINELLENKLMKPKQKLFFAQKESVKPTIHDLIIKNPGLISASTSGVMLLRSGENHSFAKILEDAKTRKERNGFL